MMDDNNEDNPPPSSSVDLSHGKNNNFTQIQSRRFRNATHFPCWSLCPSMDLIALGIRSTDTVDVAAAAPESTQGGGAEVGVLEGIGSGGTNSSVGRAGGVDVAESIAVHRILSWQSLLMLKADQLLSSSSDKSSDGNEIGGGVNGICVEDIERESRAAAATAAAAATKGEGVNVNGNKMLVDDNDDDSPPEVTKGGATSVCWSPDGRYLAVGLADGGVLIHTVEPDAAAGATEASSSGGDYSDGGSHHGALHLIRPPPPSASFHPPLPLHGRRRRSKSRSLSPVVKNRNMTAFSPRVTRSMAAARGGEGGGVAAEKKQPSSAASLAAKKPRRGRVEEKWKRPRKSGPSAVIGMTWKRLVPRRLSRNSDEQDDEEREIREAWRNTSQLIDRDSHFLPSNSNSAHHATTKTNGGLNLFSSKAHLNVLCVATTEEVHWYLQGQYRILSVPHGGSDDDAAVRVDLACSPDLSALLVVTERRAKNETRNNSSHSTIMKAKLYGMPLLPRKRFDLQILSASYRSIFSHLWDARKGICAAMNSWKAALRPLDTKFQGLLTLLSKYQPLESSTKFGAGHSSSSAGAESVRLEFLRFILSGRSTVVGDASGALDQFFTRAQMHDQLLQREARGVEAAVASVEGMLRSRVLASVRAVVYRSEELYGWARSSSKASSKGGGTSGEDSSLNLVDPEMALCLYASSRALFLTFDRCLGYVIEARGRVRDLLAWMRGTAARVRAWGTAADSVQRKNARNRRISDGVVRRVAAFMSRPMVFSSWKGNGNHDMDHRVLTECIIGMPLTDFFVAGCSQQPRVTDCGKENATLDGGTKYIRSLESTVQSIFRICTILFERPRSVFAQSLNTLDICFEVEHSIIAIHTRIGAGPHATSGGERDNTSGFFLPKINKKDTSVEECPFWTLLARSIGTAVEFIALPGGTSFEPESDKGYYLRANLMIPEGWEVTNIVFYGDDGISSLSPDLNDDAKIREGRQSLGCMMKCIDPLSIEVREELWLFEYEDVVFQKFDFETIHDEVAISATKLGRDECTFLAVLEDETSDAIVTIVPKRRHISTHRRNSQVQKRRQQVNLCGSRGTGGVVTFGAPTSLDIFDLEEDEDNTSSGGDDDESSQEDGSTT